jgi:hypothetical protein
MPKFPGKLFPGMTALGGFKCRPGPPSVERNNFCRISYYMKQESLPLISFIKDYGLQKPNGVICFIAKIYFNSEKKLFRFTSPVHVVTISIKHLDIIYLLNPDIDESRINTMYSNNKRFKYSGTKRFHIKGRSKFYGRYSIFITPISTDCETGTITEIRAKTQN